jgi:hypothetical protein
MKRLLLLAAVLVLGEGAAAAQNVSRPDCIIDITLTAAGQSAGGQGTCGNNINGVFEWRLNYKSIGFTALSLAIQSAPPDATGGCTTAIWVAFAGTLVTGVNPNTATTQASTNVTGFYPCVRVFLTSVMGSGTITGQLYGCREPGCSIAGASINAVIAPIPLPVDGPTAAGAAPTTPPVLVAGQDGAPGVIRTLKTDAVGELIPANASSADADTVSNTEITAVGAAGGILYPRVFGRVFNGTSWDRQRGNATGTTPSNASSGDADAVSNSQSTPTDVAANILYPRNMPRVFNGTTWDRQRGNTSGTSPTTASSAGADAVSNTTLTPTDSANAIIYPRVEPMAFNGATWDRQFFCTNQATVSLSAGTDVVIVTGVAATNVRICHLSWSGPTTADVTIRQGTGTTCGTNTATIAGVYGSITSQALDFQPTAALRTTVAARDVCLHFSTSVSVGGVVIYAQF